MHISRLVTGVVAICAIAITANPACSSSNNNQFVIGGDAGTPDSHFVVGPDGTIIPGQDSGHTGPLGGGMDATTGHQDASFVHDGGIFNDAKLQADSETCTAEAGGPGPVQHICVIYPAGADDGNECDGHHDVAGFPPNGSTGNGFDDNCNGLVDEGCTCGTVGVGGTKTCYLVPASQTENGAPVGWCAENSKGTVNCVSQGEGAPVWSGTCRGAQPPYPNDICAPGDFNCDGTPENPTGMSCKCQTATIACPTAPVQTIPYPPVMDLPLVVNAASWFSNPSEVSQATNWNWTLTGGDCDNILPHPSFGIYATNNGSSAPLGTQSNTLGMSGHEHGMVVSSPAVTSVLYPAFSLSGDYVLTGSWMLDGKEYSCTLQIQVRAPGLRAEACWDTVADDDDLDLHMAKITGFGSTCAGQEAWSDLACSGEDQDCYYGDCVSGLNNMAGGKWGFPASPASACVGWGSQATGSTCKNPRLDRDANGLSGACNPNVINPNNNNPGGPFCGSENINVDAPAVGDQYAVGVRFYGMDGTDTNPAHTHANIYCNGARVLSVGYDPTTTPIANFPQLVEEGEDSTGDMWKVGLVTITAGDGGGVGCEVTTTQSTTPDTTRDGPTNAFCVDNYEANGANSQEYIGNTTPAGGPPTSANQMCFH